MMERVFRYILIIIILSCFKPLVGLCDESALTQEEQEWLAQRNGKIVLAYNTNWPPLTFVDDKGNFAGIAADYIKLVEKRLGTKFVLRGLDSLEKVLSEVDSGKADVVAAVAPTVQRSEFLDFTTTYCSIPTVIITRKDLDMQLNLADMHGWRVAMVQKSAVEEFVHGKYPDVHLVCMPNYVDVIKRFSAGECDAAIVELTSASYIIEKHDIKNLRLAGYTGHEYNLALGSRKDQPILNSILTKALKSITDDERDDIHRKWITLRYQKENKLAVFTVLTTVVFAAITAIVLIYIFRYHHKVNSLLSFISLKYLLVILAAVMVSILAFVLLRLFVFKGRVVLSEDERAWLAEYEDEIRLAPDPFWPPIEYFDEYGEYKGIVADYVKEIEKSLGIKFNIVRLKDWDEVISKSKTRGIDVYPAATESPERLGFMDFTQPYLELPCVIITRKNVTDYVTLEQLRGKKVAVGAGYVFQEYIQNDYPDVILVPVSDIRTGLRKVSFGEVDALAANIASVSYYIEKQGITNLRVAGETDYSAKLSFASRNDWPMLNKIFKKALASIGWKERDVIYRKWVRLDYKPFYKKTGFWVITGSALIAVFSVIVLIVSWNLTLKHQVRLRTKELQDNLNFITALIETFPHPIFYKNTESRYVGCNAAFGSKIIGASKDEIVGRTLFDFQETVTKELAQEYHENDMDLFKNPGTRMLESSMMCADGVYRDFIFSKGTYENANGEVDGIVGIMVDVTELKQAERALQESENRYEMVVKQSSQLIYDYNVATGDIVWAGAIRKVTGYEPDEFKVMNIDEWENNLHPDDHDEAVKKLEEAKEAVGKYLMEYRFRRKDGSYVYIEEDGVYLPDENGVPVRMLGVMKDIDERKKVEAERERLLRRLAAKNKELESIVFVSSHDLRSPLVNIEGHSGELKMSCQDLQKLLADVTLPDDKQRQLSYLLNEDIPTSVGFVTSSTHKMTVLLNGLLRLCRLGISTVEMKKIEANAMFRDILAAMNYQIESLRITVDVESLPDCYGDEGLVNQVFSNLIDNAIKYRSPDREAVIKVTGRVERDRSIYCVQDNGVGIPAEYQKKIFEIFHRLNPEDEVKGEGLGLTIVRRIVDRLNGRVWLESEKDKGSSFYVALPNKPTEIQEPQLLS